MGKSLITKSIQKIRDDLNTNQGSAVAGVSKYFLPSPEAGLNL